VDEPKVAASMTINGADGVPELLNQPIGIEIRGQSSQHFPFKKNFGFRLRKNNGKRKKLELGGMPKASDWILHGPITDKPLIRNSVAFDIARAAGLSAPNYRFVELYIHDDTSSDKLFEQYRGVYLLMDKAEVRKGRIELKELKATDKKESKISGGYFLELTTPEKLSPKDNPICINDFACFVIKYPARQDINMQQLAWIERYLRSLNAAITEAGRGQTSRYEDYVDTENLLDFMLFNELLKNYDAFSASTYMQKERAGKLIFGPVWDLNLTMGNVYINPDRQRDELFIDGLVSPRRGSIYTVRERLWASELLSQADFADRYRARWRELRDGPWRNSELMRIISDTAAYIDAVAKRNYERWPVVDTQIDLIQGVQPDSHTHAVQLLKRWIRKRADCLDTYFEQSSGAFSRDSSKALNDACKQPRQPTAAPGQPEYPDPQLRQAG